MTYNKLPADPTAIILGIIAIVISFAGCCCGVFAVVPLAMSIIGLVMANKSLKEFHQNQNAYSQQSRSNVATAKIINIVALILSSIITLIYIAYFAFYGSIMSAAVLDGIKNGDFENNDDDTYQDYEWENDTINNREDEEYVIEKVVEEIEVKEDSIKEKSPHKIMKDFNSKN